MRNICVITGSRADYGLLKKLIKNIDKDRNFNLKLLVTGSHLSEECPIFKKPRENHPDALSRKRYVGAAMHRPTLRQ